MNNNNNNSNQINSRIQEIADRLDQLEINYVRETNNLLSELADIRRVLRQTVVPEEPTERIPVAAVRVEEEEQFYQAEEYSVAEEPFDIGDIVEITNRYKGKKGTVGNIVKIKNNWIYLKDLDNEVHQRDRNNVKRDSNHDARKFRSRRDSKERRKRWF